MRADQKAPCLLHTDDPRYLRDLPSDLQEKRSIASTITNVLVTKPRSFAVRQKTKEYKRKERNGENDGILSGKATTEKGKNCYTKSSPLSVLNGSRSCAIFSILTGKNLT
jgi:hypothetical protein